MKTWFRSRVTDISGMTRDQLFEVIADKDESISRLIRDRDTLNMEKGEREWALAFLRRDIQVVPAIVLSASNH